MLAKVNSCAIIGLEGAIIEVEVDSSNGLSSFIPVGLLDTAALESTERVRAVIRNSGLHYPGNCITVNLGCANHRFSRD